MQDIDIIAKQEFLQRRRENLIEKIVAAADEIADIDRTLAALRGQEL